MDQAALTGLPVDAPAINSYIATMMRRAMLLGAAFWLIAAAAVAEDYSAGGLTVVSPWSRATPRGLTVAAVYMTIRNDGATPDRLLDGTTPAASRFEIHSTVIEDGVARMRPVTGGLEIAPGKTVELKPGALHVMLLGVKQPMREGDRVKATLTFERAGSVDIEFVVRSIGAQTGG
jgi:copper(I)-binding protein